MEKRKLGSSDLMVSTMGLGTNNFAFREDIDPFAVVTKALDLGVNLFDTAEAYGSGRSEEILGQALGSRRHEAIIATKWGGGGEVARPGTGSRDYIFAAAERSLRNLGTDYIDVFQYHKHDLTVPLEETFAACADLVRQGKVRYVGVSNMAADQVAQAFCVAQKVGLGDLVSCQEAFNLIRRDDVEPDLAKVLTQNGMSLLPWGPLASGLLTGKYTPDEPAPAGSRFDALPMFRDRYVNDRNWLLVASFRAYAEKEGIDLLTLALSWLAAQPLVPSIIAGATSPTQLERNLEAMSWKIAADQLLEIDAIYAQASASA